MLAIWGALKRAFSMPTANLAAWYKAETGVTTATGVSTWADQSGNSRSLLQATAANQPVYLDYSGTKYSYHPGVAGNYISTPNAAANQITGDIDIRWYGKLDSVAPATVQHLVNHFDGSTVGMTFTLNTSGLLSLVWSTTAFVSTVTLASQGLVSNQLIGLRFTRVSSSGLVTFYTSVDGGVSWQQLGATGTASGGISYTVPLRIGTNNALTGVLSGRTYRAQIYRGINGTLAVDYNPADYTSGTTLTSSTTGEVWTINSTGSLPCQIVDKASLLFNGTSHYLKTNAFTLNQPETIYLVAKQVSWTAGDYLLDGNTANTGALIQTTATPQLNISAGTSVAGNTGAAVGSPVVITMVFNGASSLLQINNGVETTGNAGAGNMGGITLGASGGNIAWGNLQVYEMASYSAAHDAATRSTINLGLKAKWSI